VLLAVNVYFAATKPCTSAEGAVYERFASHTLLELWKSPLDPRLGLVYGVLARIATRMGGVSELTIRIPAILGGLLFWIGLSTYCRRWRGWAAVLAFLGVAANPWTFHAFSTATGAALAVGLLMTAMRFVERNGNAASLLMGLAMGSDALVALPVMAASVVAAPILKIKVWKWVDELLLPGLVAGLMLLLPALLIRGRPVDAATSDRGMRELVRQLIKQPRGAGNVRVAVSPRLEPGLFFYRRRYHLDWLLITPVDQDVDFYIAENSSQPFIAKRGLRVSKTAPGVILAVR
jgi:hypothetical protein